MIYGDFRDISCIYCDLMIFSHLLSNQIEIKYESIVPPFFWMLYDGYFG